MDIHSIVRNATTFPRTGDFTRDGRIVENIYISSIPGVSVPLVVKTFSTPLAGVIDSFADKTPVFPHVYSRIPMDVTVYEYTPGETLETELNNKTVTVEELKNVLLLLADALYLIGLKGFSHGD
jgi:hypothetical protein